MFEKSKTLLELKKIQAAQAKEIIEPQLVADAELPKLEKWIESAVTQAITKSQQLAAEKMKSVAGGLGLPGF